MSEVWDFEDGSPKVTHWTYRVLKEPSLQEYYYHIVEVYYNEDKPIAWTDHANPAGESLEELKRDLQKMFEALEKPVLTQEDFGR